MNILKQIKVWGNSIIWSFGLLWLAIKIINFFFTEWATENIQPHWWFFLVIGIIIALIRNIPKRSFVCEIDENDTSVEIRIGDIFNVYDPIVVGTNTTFDTTMEDGTISPKSIQGVFTDKYCASVAELDQKLSNCLQSLTPKELTDTEKPYGKKKQYPMGTVAKIDCKDRTAYFVSMAHMTKEKTASASGEDILDTLPLLWEFIRSHGDLGNICMPIIGSGFARVNAKKETLIQEILKSFVAACSEGRICEKITLFIHPNDIKKGKVNFDNISNFMKHICAYENKRIGSQTVDTIKSEAIDNSQLKKHIKATCFLLDDDGDSLSPRKDFRTIIENVAGTIEKAVPVLLETTNLKMFIEKCGKSLTISEELDFNSRDQMKRPQYKTFSTGILSFRQNGNKTWALDFSNNVYLNENAKNLLNKEFVKLKVSIEQL